MKNSRIPGTREQINGVRKTPNGVRIESGIANFDAAWEKAKKLERNAKNGETFNVSGFAGNYCLLKYGAKLENDYIHMT